MSCFGPPSAGDGSLPMIKFAPAGVGWPSILFSGGASWIGPLQLPNLPFTVTLAGVLPYFYFSVLYDAEKGIIGLKRRKTPIKSGFLTTTATLT
jgi:hypothetical protein